MNFKYSKYVLLIIISMFFQSCYSQNDIDLNDNFTGLYLFKMFNSDIGYIEYYVDIEKTEDGTYSGYAREKALGNVFGLWNSIKFKLFTPYFDRGSLIRFQYITLKDDSTFNGKLISVFNNYIIKGKIKNQSLEITLYNGIDEIRGKIIADKVKERIYKSNYKEVTQNAIDSAEKYLYDPKIIESSDWEKFRKKLLKASLKVKEDIDIVFAFFYYAEKLDISHFFLYKENQLEELNYDNSENNSSVVNLEKFNNKIGVLTINSFAGYSKEISNAIDSALDYDTLIVDLRNNSGGDIEGGFAFASRFVKEPVEGGYFLTRKWFQDNSGLPKDPYEKFPIISEANYNLLIDGIHLEPGICMKIFPKKPTYSGKLYILISNTTASTCEPIVYYMKKRNIATLIGSKTAGAMLNAEYFDLPQNFKLVIPTADYYTDDNNRLEKNGVTPDKSVERNYSIKEIITLIHAK